MIIIVLLHKMKLTGCTLTQRLMKIKLQLVSLLRKHGDIRCFLDGAQTKMCRSSRFATDTLVSCTNVTSDIFQSMEIKVVLEMTANVALFLNLSLRLNLDQDQNFHHFLCTFISFSLYFYLKPRSLLKKLKQIRTYDRKS